MYELTAGPLQQRRRWQMQTVSLGFHIGLIALFASISGVTSSTEKSHEERSIPATTLYLFPRASFGMERTKATLDGLAKISMPKLRPNESVVKPAREPIAAGLDAPVATTFGYRPNGSAVIGSLNTQSGETSSGYRGEGAAGVVGFFPAAVISEAEQRPAAPTMADEPAELLSAPAPLYTEEAKRLKLSGEVVLEVILTASGRVQVLRVLSEPLGHGLDQAAVEAASRVRCRPARTAGKLVDVVGRISVIFRIS